VPPSSSQVNVAAGADTEGCLS